MLRILSDEDVPGDIERELRPGHAAENEPTLPPYWSASIVDKSAALLELAKKRQASRWDGYNNIGDYHCGVYECDFVSPYTKSAGNVDADVMIFLQDWSSDDSLKGPIHPDREEFGYRRDKKTNKKLIELLNVHFSLVLKDVYATNLFPFIKPGGRSKDIPVSDMRRAAREFGLPQLEIVSPKIAICLGLKTYNALRTACNLPDLPRLSDAIDSPFCHRGSIVFCRAHPAVRGKNRGTGQVLQDWSRMASFYKTMPDNRAEISEWFSKWQHAVSEQQSSSFSGNATGNEITPYVP